MNRESSQNSPAEISNETKLLKDIYNAGFTAGAKGLRPKKVVNSAHYTEWLRGWSDGKDTTPGQSNLGPDEMKRRRQKLGIDNPEQK